ncbi:hypothetical protein D9M72_566330 [compost metagenome]
MQVREDPFPHHFGVAGAAQDPAEPLQVPLQPDDGVLREQGPVGPQHGPGAAGGGSHLVHGVRDTVPDSGVMVEELVDLGADIGGHDVTYGSLFPCRPGSHAPGRGPGLAEGAGEFGGVG